MDKISVWRNRTFIWKPEHPHSNNRGYILRSRYMMEQSLGRYLNPITEQIHHINENSMDDRIENFEIISVQNHIKRHNIISHRTRKLNYYFIKLLRKEFSLGYKKISKLLNYKSKSVQSALKILAKEGKIKYGAEKRLSTEGESFITHVEDNGWPPKISITI